MKPGTLGLFAIASTIAGSTVPAQAAPASLDERQYVAEVLRVGLDARVVDAEAALGRAEAVGVGAWPNPGVSWARESARSQPGAFGTQDIFALSLTLVPSGRLGLERQAAAKTVDAALARRARARAQLRHEAVAVFYAAVGAAERRVALAASRDRGARLAQVIATREKAGEASGYDRIRIGLESAAIEDLLRGVALAEKRATAAALALLGPEYDRLPKLEGSVGAGPPPVETRALAQALETRRADLQALRHDADAAETARQAAARGWIPDVTLSGGVQLLDAGRPNETRGYVAGVGVTLPFFQRRQGEGARAEAQQSLAEARRASLTREATAILATAIAESEGRRARLEAHRAEVLARAEELQQIAATAYRGGAAELLVLVDAERAGREARTAAIDLALAVIEADNDLALLAGTYDATETRSSK